MPKSDTWPGGVAMESLSNMDSAGSCDSVISMNSGYSEDSMEYLSAEERACLMYLEETIEALEVQEDSGLSNDEPDPGLPAETVDQMRVNGISSFNSDEYGDPTSDTAEHHAQTPEPQSSPASADNTIDAETSVSLVTQPKPPVTDPGPGCEVHPSAPQPGMLYVAKDGDGNLKIVSSADHQSTKASELDVSLIPPPSDFRDEPGPLVQPERAKYHLPSVGISRNKPQAVDLKLLCQRASAKRSPASSPVTQEPSSRPPELSPLVLSSFPQMSPLPDAAEPRSPPSVAPKPKKLPANIILKSHKTPVTDGNSGHSVPTGGDRLLLDPQRVRIEALRKLGLLKNDDGDSVPNLSPKLSPKSRRSWAAPASPISPAAPHTPPVATFYPRFNSPPPASVPLQFPVAASPSDTPTAPAVQPPDILPAPAAFSDPSGPLLSDNELSVANDVSEPTLDGEVNTPPLTPPFPMKQLTPPKVTGVKSATLERSGLGLSSYMSSQESSEGGQGKQSPSQLRNNRPRPASMGSVSSLSSAQGEGSQVAQAAIKEPDLRRSLPAPQHSRDAQKLPRSQGISVLICPRAENEDNRREALKRLGLLRD